MTAEPSAWAELRRKALTQAEIDAIRNQRSSIFTPGDLVLTRDELDMLCDTAELGLRLLDERDVLARQVETIQTEADTLAMTCANYSARFKSDTADYVAVKAERDAALAAQQTADARIVELEGTLTYWKTCSNCGQQMDSPGNCSVAKHEWQEGQEAMLEETLTRAESAEAERDRVRAAVTALFGPAVDIAELSPAEWQRRVKVVKSALAAGAAPTTEKG